MQMAASYQVWAALMVRVMIPILVAAGTKLYGQNIWIPPVVLLKQIAMKQLLPLGGWDGNWLVCSEGNTTVSGAPESSGEHPVLRTSCSGLVEDGPCSGSCDATATSGCFVIGGWLEGRNSAVQLRRTRSSRRHLPFATQIGMWVWRFYSQVSTSKREILCRPWLVMIWWHP